jgi:hypothetical protein
MNGLADPSRDDRVSGTALSPCPGSTLPVEHPGRDDGTAPLASQASLDPAEPMASPLSAQVVAVRRELRELTQEITPLIGYLADLSGSRRLVEWAWLFDELGAHAEHVQSHAMLLKHMCDVAWERTYQLGREAP